jgi:hypothetical protein
MVVTFQYQCGQLSGLHQEAGRKPNAKGFALDILSDISYFLFPTRICVNQHYWLALKMKQPGIRCTQTGVCLRSYSDPGLCRGSPIP